MAKEIRGKWVLVTGAGSGIGLETACAFARAGAKLVLVDVNESALLAARQRIEAMATQVHTYVCDVADESAVQQMAGQVSLEVGPLDVLVNNAGVFFLGGVTQTPLSAWRRLIEINLIGVVNITQAFLPAMQGSPGVRRIINVASLAGVLPAPNMAAYAACKHAVVGFSEVLAMELQASEMPGRVGVTVVCPGVIHTPLAQNIAAAGHISGRQIAALQTYYRNHGCEPKVIGEGIVKSVWKDSPLLCLGPQAASGYLVSRLSRRLARWLSLRAARTNGYLEPLA